MMFLLLSDIFQKARCCGARRLERGVGRLDQLLSLDHVTSLSVATDLATLNAALSSALAQSRLVSSASGFTWDWSKREDALDQMLWPIARSAADLLTAEKLNQVSVCANGTCGWLFVDTSRNHSRRWCDMRDCGNRAKARRHYQRIRQSARRTPTRADR